QGSVDATDGRSTQPERKDGGIASTTHQAQAVAAHFGAAHAIRGQLVCGEGTGREVVTRSSGPPRHELTARAAQREPRRPGRGLRPRPGAGAGFTVPAATTAQPLATPARP